ncbi:tether containing UBX domain for GLUT4 [Aplysia californica]|uniref:Tether containing UBX domain for GLUT4 n=1 Tax=Aplysia californica TaxID=6500 RepID=A0ABM1A7E4_APLCA|nr:tether containing UBX domain for GLUT4 [Aplysia californica]
MAASVQVLCPNGRRQNVKITPNTKLLQILEEVCQRQGFIPPEDYKLVHGRKELDLSLSVRFSSIPNNAKLELAKSSAARVEQDVTIALQLDSGQRLQDSFPPSVDLWSILIHFESKNSEHKGVLTRVDSSHTPPLHPVCIFMREEVIGEPALKATTLRKLALTSGKAIIRLLHRPVDGEVMSKIVDDVAKDKQKQARLEEIALKKSEQLQDRGTPTEGAAAQNPGAELRGRDMDEKSTGSPLASVAEESVVTSDMDVSETPVTSDPSKSSISTESSSGKKDISEPMEEGPESVTSSTSDSSSFVSPLAENSQNQSRDRPTNSSSRGASAIDELRNLNIPGVEVFTPDDFSDLSPQEQAMARRLAQRLLPQLQHVMVSSMDASPSPPRRPRSVEAPPSFADFKFPESTRGQDLTSANNSNFDPRLCAPCEREVMIYSTEESLTQSQQQELSDDFFEVTTDDVKKMYRDLQNAVQQMEEQPLMTQSLRNAQAEAAFDHYDRVVIRIQFPDRLVLQAFFRPRENVSALHAIVKEYLQDKTDKFYLYTSPPKTVLSGMATSLAVNHLAPAALVYFGCNTQREHYLREDVRSDLSSRLKAELAVSNALHGGESGQPSGTGSPANGTSQPGPSGVGRQAGVASSSSGSSSSGSSSRSSRPANLPSGTQVPKWLKLSKK